jgi:hypothetical protein
VCQDGCAIIRSCHSCHAPSLPNPPSRYGPPLGSHRGFHYNGADESVVPELRRSERCACVATVLPLTLTIHPFVPPVARQIGIGSAVRHLVNTSAPPAFDDGSGGGGLSSSPPPLRHLRVLRTVDGLSDHLSVCVEGAGGGGGVKVGSPIQYRYWRELSEEGGTAQLRRQHACGSVAGGRGRDGPSHEGLYYHFMCSKWSAAFWALGQDNTTSCSISSPASVIGSYGTAHVPSRLRHQCSVHGVGR